MSEMSEPIKNALFSYPPQAAFGRTLPKNKLYEKAGANTRLKDLFVAQVDQIVWQYKLAPETINLPAKPVAKDLISLAESWSPYRSTAALLLWRYYAAVRNKEGLSI